MDSRLPKPNFKKTIKQVIVPSNRLISNNDAFGALPRNPLSRLNLPSGLQRHVSPDIGTKTNAKLTSHMKLRRSRSACDLRDHLKPIKRLGAPLETIPSKIIKGNSMPIRNGAPVATNATRSRPNFIKISCLPSQPSVEEKKKPMPSAKAAVKHSIKRIPAYDYKARFNDLQEKHKYLKERYETSQEQLQQMDNLPEQYELCQEELATTKEELKSANNELKCLNQQKKHDQLEITALTQDLRKTTKDLKDNQHKNSVLQREHNKVTKEFNDLKEKTTSLSTEHASMVRELSEVQELLFKSNCERKELHNAVMDLRGNIRVFCRVRPPLPSENDRVICGWQYIDETSLEISTNECQPSGARHKQTKHDFSFDQIFHPRSSQSDIFELVSPLIQSALDGYNICIFAYGQTGSGKTYTMDGMSNQIGIIPRTVDLLFDCVKNYKRLGWTYEIKVTFLEIYNEILYDLLSNETKDMDIRMANAKNPTEIYVSNITEITVTNAQDLRDLMNLAKSNRATATTVGNERSSRSHAVTRIQLNGIHTERNETCVGTINLVDLAGSESPKTSTRMEETKKINKSLSELTNVIMALLQKQEHVPFRNSKLTHLLMPCLGGNSKTLMFINLAPFQDCFVESVKSLRFATSVNSCKMSKVKKNKFLNTSNSQVLQQLHSSSFSSSN